MGFKELELVLKESLKVIESLRYETIKTRKVLSMVNIINIITLIVIVFLLIKNY